MMSFLLNLITNIGTKETFIQAFLRILKHLFQNFEKICKNDFLSITNIGLNLLHGVTSLERVKRSVNRLLINYLLTNINLNPVIFLFSSMIIFNFSCYV